MEEREHGVQVDLRGGRQRGLQIRGQGLLSHAFYFLFKRRSSAERMKGIEANLDTFCRYENWMGQDRSTLKAAEAVTMS